MEPLQTVTSWPWLKLFLGAMLTSPQTLLTLAGCSTWRKRNPRLTTPTLALLRVIVKLSSLAFHETSLNFWHKVCASKEKKDARMSIRAFFVIVVVFFVFNVVLYNYLQGTSQSATVFFDNAVGTERFLRQVDELGEGSNLRRYSADATALFVAYLSIQATLLVALFSALGWPVFFDVFKKEYAVLMIGLGGVGKTTLINRVFNENGSRTDVTKEYKRETIDRPIDGKKRHVVAIDHVGQDLEDLNARVQSLHAFKNHKIDEVVIMLSIFPLRKVDGEWEFIDDTDEQFSAKQAEFIEKQNEFLFSGLGIGALIGHISGIRKVTVVFNQVDMFFSSDDGRSKSLDCKSVEQAYGDAFPNCMDAIEDAARVYSKRHNKKQYEIERRYASAKLGIEIRIESGTPLRLVVPSDNTYVG